MVKIGVTLIDSVPRHEDSGPGPAGGAVAHVDIAQLEGKRAGLVLEKSKTRHKARERRHHQTLAVFHQSQRNALQRHLNGDIRHLQ